MERVLGGWPGHVVNAMAINAGRDERIALVDQDYSVNTLLVEIVYL